MLKSIIKLTIALAFIFIFCAQMQAQDKDSSESKPKTKVYLAGIGPDPQIQIILDGLTDFLVEKKVSTKQIDSESKSRSGHIDRLKVLGGESLLYVTLDIAEGQVKDSMLVQCFDPTGKLLWEEKVKGSLFSTSASGVAKSMLKGMKKKLEPRIGKEGLPIN